MVINHNNNEDLPKFACQSCGSVKLRGDFYTRQVFLAVGNEILQLESGVPEWGKLVLSCLSCDEEIENWPTEEIPIE